MNGGLGRKGKNIPGYTTSVSRGFRKDRDKKRIEEIQITYVVRKGVDFEKRSGL